MTIKAKEFWLNLGNVDTLCFSEMKLKGKTISKDIIVVIITDKVQFYPRMVKIIIN